MAQTNNSTLLLDAKTKTVTNPKESFFTSSVADLRYSGTTFARVDAINPIDSEMVHFKLPPLGGSIVYRPNCIIAHVALKLTKADGVHPPNRMIVRVEGGSASVNLCQPCNNTGHALFKDIQIKLGKNRLNANSEGYNIKAYIKTLLGTSLSARNSRLNECGFYACNDNVGLSDNIHRARYMEQGTTNIVYSDKPVPYSFELLTDLADTHVPLPPNVGMELFFYPTAHKNRVMSFPGDKEEYKLKIVDFFLCVKTSTLSDSIYNEFRHKINKTPAVIPWKKTTLNTYNISATLSSYTVGDMFPTGVIPAKVIIAFMRADDFRGKRSTSQYLFSRAWMVSAERKLNGLPMNFKLNKHGTEMTQLDEAKYCYIVSCTIKYANNPLDHMERDNTLRDASMDFKRMNYTESFDETPIGMMDYATFCYNSRYFKCYDLSVGHNSNVADLMPVVRKGQYTLQVTFSQNLPAELVMLVQSEESSLFAVNNNGIMTPSYTG